MSRCLELARLAWPSCRPNPMVGAVIVYDGKIIGEGYTQEYGSDHAEIVAINSVEDSSLFTESTLYVSLEPCSHYGKTPPCSKRIIEVGIKRVVVSTVDTYSKVSGQGIKNMIEAGIDVSIGTLEEEARRLNKRFFTFNEKKRPYVILKWAESKDGFIDTFRNNKSQKAQKITGDKANQVVHQWRSEEQAILVGGNTVRLDNPLLNVRYTEGPDPIRIVISPTNDLPADSNIFNSLKKTIIFNSSIHRSEKNIQWVKIDFKDDWIDRMYEVLYDQGIQSMLIEGGSMTLNSLIQSGKFDEIRRFTSDAALHEGVEAPMTTLPIETIVQLGNDRLDIIKNFS